MILLKPILIKAVLIYLAKDIFDSSIFVFEKDVTHFLYCAGLPFLRNPTIILFDFFLVLLILYLGLSYGFWVSLIDVLRIIHRLLVRNN